MRQFLGWVTVCCLVTAWAGTTEAQQRQLVSFGPFQAFVAAGNDWCGADADIEVRSDDPSAFVERRQDLQKLVGGLRAVLSFECPQVERLHLTGIEGRQAVYAATLSAANNWLLPAPEPAPRAAEPPPKPVATQSLPQAQPAPKPVTSMPPKPAAPASSSTGPQTLAAAPVEARGEEDDAPWAWIVGSIVVLALIAVVLWLFSRRRGSTIEEPESTPDNASDKAGELNQQVLYSSTPAEQHQPQQEEPIADDDPLQAQVRKYEKGLADLMDRRTELQRAKGQSAERARAATKDLNQFLALVAKTVRTSLKRHHHNRFAGIARALLLVPMFRFIWGLPLLFRIAGLIAFAWAALAAVGYLAILVVDLLPDPDLQLEVTLELATYGVLYLLVLTPAFYFWDRHQYLKSALGTLDQDAGGLKKGSLDYVYEGRTASNKVTCLRVDHAAGDGDPKVVEEAHYQQLRGIQGATLLTLHGSAPFYTCSIQGEKTSRVYALEENAFIAAGNTDELETAFAQHLPFLAKAIEFVKFYGQLIQQIHTVSQQISRAENVLKNVQQLRTIWDAVVISKDALAFLLRRIDLFNLSDAAVPRGILLYGMPGNGKEFLARAIARSVFSEFIKVDTSTLRDGDSIRALWNAMRERKNAIIYLENADKLFPKEEGGNRELVTAWLEEWGKNSPATSRLWVLMSAGDDKMLHESVQQMIGSSKLEVIAPDRDGRLRVLQEAMREHGVPGTVPDFVADDTAGTSIHDLRAMVAEAKLQSYPEPPSTKQWKEAIKIIRGADAVFKDEKKSWERLILADDIKDYLKNVGRMLSRADEWEAAGHELPKGLLLYGPPGTGKTEIARTLANEAGLQFMAVTTADIKAGYIGQSGQKTKAVFAKARSKAPCILFIDEIESVAAQRGSEMADQFTQEIVTQMLQEMDGAQKAKGHVFVLAATNIPEAIDPAILSRFTEKKEIPLPDLNGRTRILQGMLNDRIHNPKVDIDNIAGELAKLLEGKSGRDLKMFVNRVMERELLRAGSPDKMELTLEKFLEAARPKGANLSDGELAQIWSTIILSDSIQGQLLSKIRMFNRADPAAPRGMLLFGPPGTGKTEIARKIAKSCGCHFMPLSIPDLKAGHIGQSGQNVRKIWNEARGRGRCVIFVDECEGVFGRRGSVNSDSFSDEIVQAFLAEWDGMANNGQIWVVGATNRRDLLDEAIVSRFGASIEIGLPDEASRGKILHIELQKLQRDCPVPDFAIKESQGFSGRKLATLARDVCAEGEAITEQTWRRVLDRHQDASAEKVDANATWEALVLPSATKEKLKGLCGMLKHMEVLAKQNVTPPRGALLYGPPGTGKTQIARTLANESGLAFIAATTADLKAGYVGQSGQLVKSLFERARGQSPCILFIDEIESLVPSRGGGGADQFTQEIVTQLLQELDGVKKQDAHVFLLAATNIPDAVDSAILSRLPERLEIPLPPKEDRAQLCRILLGKMRLDGIDLDDLAQRLAEATEGRSGRDLRSLIEGAQQNAVRRALAENRPDNISIRIEDFELAD